MLKSKCSVVVDTFTNAILPGVADVLEVVPETIEAEPALALGTLVDREPDDSEEAQIVPGRRILHRPDTTNSDHIRADECVPGIVPGPGEYHGLAGRPAHRPKAC